MALFLNNYIGIIACVVGALLLLCSALLIMLFRRQKNMLNAANEQQQHTSACFNAAANALEARLRDEMARQQSALLSASAEEARNHAQQMNALGARLDQTGQQQEARLHRIAATLDEKLAANNLRAEKLRETLSDGMEKLRQENEQKLEQMRQTVDEKLHETLNKRLGESFSLVNERLEQVYKGLGEMQTLASGVGDLKKMLSNVKTRGIWGEVQLGTLLEQMLSPGQYLENAQVVPHARERVEYAVVLPGQSEQPVYLAIDSKFPLEAYERLLVASEAGDASAVSVCSAELQTCIRTEARRISEKYIKPPYTTDFAVMFLATEGLYAEALRARGLLEEIQQKYHVLIAGPSTLAALLSSLQLGFKTLAIEQRSAEVWNLLSAVKTEFIRFGNLLDQTQQRLRQAGDTIEKAASKTRAINRRLRDVETLNAQQAAQFLDLPEEDDISGA